MFNSKNVNKSGTELDNDISEFNYEMSLTEN